MINHTPTLCKRKERETKYIKIEEEVSALPGVDGHLYNLINGLVVSVLLKKTSRLFYFYSWKISVKRNFRLFNDSELFCDAFSTFSRFLESGCEVWRTALECHLWKGEYDTVVPQPENFFALSQLKLKKNSSSFFSFIGWTAKVWHQNATRKNLKWVFKCHIG